MQEINNLNEFEISTPLQEPFSYSIIPIVVLGFLIIILVFLYIFLKSKKKKNTIPVIIEPNLKDRNQIKAIYLNKLNELLKKVEENSITNRFAYQELSILIREFIYEMTNIKVQNYTLSDIEKINIPILYELVKEYYEPEFSKSSEGNILISLEKTRKVMESWN